MPRKYLHRLLINGVYHGMQRRYEDVPPPIPAGELRVYTFFGYPFHTYGRTRIATPDDARPIYSDRGELAVRKRFEETCPDVYPYSLMVNDGKLLPNRPRQV